MGEFSKIGIATHTWSPWIGCTQVSAGCDNCRVKAEWQDRWHKVSFGKDMPRRPTSQHHWQEPKAWNRRAKLAGGRESVWVELCDIFDPSAPDMDREAFWTLVELTPSLDWLICTKYPGNWPLMLPWGVTTGWWANVWLGVSVENQTTLKERLPLLRDVQAGLKFVCFEPLLDYISLYGYLHDILSVNNISDYLHWMILGGEVGPSARACYLNWLTWLVRDADILELPVYVKQLGSRPREASFTPFIISDHDGAKLSEFPACLQRRDFPYDKMADLATRCRP